MSKSFIFTILFLSSASTFARKPAVEPILGVSIEEYREVDPAHAQGYNFDSTSKGTIKETARIHDIKDLKVESSKDGPNSNTLLLIFLIFLPVIASGLAFLRYFKKDHTNVIDLNTVRNNKPVTDDENDNIPKAS